MVRVNGVTLIERMLRQLEGCNLSRIVIVVGYKGQELMEHIAGLGIQTSICYVENAIYDRTNNIYSLALAREYLVKEDTLLLESDIIFEDSVIRALLDDERETLALVDRYESWMDGTCVRLGEDDSIDSFVPREKFVFSEAHSYYKTVNLYKFSRSFSENFYVPFLDAYCQALGNNEYYEQVLRVIAMLDDPQIKAKKLSGQMWYEIDDIQDLDIAASLFAGDGEERVAAIQSRYGGYWRYPEMTDYCYLVNPYYPPKRLMEEMKANYEVLLTQYPSGMRVNSLLAAKVHGVRPESIVVGNGAAELIKELLARLEGRFGLVRPTFEEYPNRLEEGRCEVFFPQREDFSYNAKDLMEYFQKKDIRNLLLINPDNPSGNYLPHTQVLQLAQWCQSRRIRLVLDESFADFAQEKDNTMIREEYFRTYPEMVVVKSISKSHGIPGARLGVLASGDEKLMEGLKRGAAIWNINSFGEFYLQIADKYKKDYEAALDRLCQSRRKLVEGLGKVEQLRVFPSEANFVMAELTGGKSAGELTRRLLLQENLLIKDLTKKIRDGHRQLIRLAVRTEEENERLVRILTDYLG